MVTGGSPLPSGYLLLTDPASAAASSAASLASAVTAGDTEERVRKGPVDPQCGSPLELTRGSLTEHQFLPEHRGTCAGVEWTEEATAFTPCPSPPQEPTGRGLGTASMGQPWRNSWDFSSNTQAEMVLTSSSFILISFSVSVSGVGRGRIGMGLSILLS